MLGRKWRSYMVHDLYAPGVAECAGTGQATWQNIYCSQTSQQLVFHMRNCQFMENPLSGDIVVTILSERLNSNANVGGLTFAAILDFAITYSH
ncbi:hypothetical protein J6590_041040 [Homalodisca vitripennis]|nr:hypothetical protein J6590_041040 [Homalodisca vitripennis]